VDPRVRAGTAADCEQVCRLLEEVDALHSEARPDIFRRAERARDFLAATLASPTSALLVAEEAGEVLGALRVSIQDAPDVPALVPRRLARVSDLVVRAGARRRGIGRDLMREAHRWAARNGASAVALTVFEFNRDAIAFYEDLGYAPQSRTMARDLDREATA
jgi:ribosomal protein S18 acetylase RimI-like enzyme